MDFPLSGLEVKDKMFRHVLIAGTVSFLLTGTDTVPFCVPCDE